LPRTFALAPQVGNARGLRLSPSTRSLLSLPKLLQVRVVIGLVSQQEAQLRGQFREQGRALDIVGDIGRDQVGGQGDSDRRDGGDEVQLPAVDPAVPDRLGPVGLGVDGGVGHDPALPIRLVPDPADRPQDGAGDRRRPATSAQGLIAATRNRPRQPIWAGSVSGIAFNRRSNVRRVG
jgi:hypothetical protein